MRKSTTKRKREEDDSTSIHDEEDSRSGLTMVSVPKGKEKDAEYTAPKSQKLTDLDEETAKDGKDSEEGNVIEQTHYIIIPSYSSWFDYNAIHQIEKRGLPEFFNGRNKSKTPEVYVAYRNFMIDTYRLNPFEYLSSTACRRNLGGDVCAILRVHSFLEQWGLINYQVDAEARPAPVAPPCTSHFMVLADTPMGLQPVQPTPPSSQIDETKKEKEDENVKEEERTSVKMERLGDAGLKTDQYAKQLTAMKTRGAAPGRDWTDQETLLLLEALEMFKDDWNKVADHVGSRTQDECIMRFLQLPIQDPYLEEGGAEAEILGPLAYQPIPFSQSGNPVMSTVAFLASVVDPRVAASATKAAIEEFAKMKEEVPPLVVEAHTRNVEATTASRGDKVEGGVGLNVSGIATDDKEKSKAEEEKKESEEPMETTEKKKENETNGAESADKEESRSAINENIQAAAAAALAAAAVKAKHLATIEERRIKSLVAQLVETQMKKLEMKLRHFDELEAIMDKEREALEYQRQQLILERQSFHMDQLRYLEQRAKHEAHSKLVSSGQLPPTLPPGFEVAGPPQPQQQVQVAVPPAPSAPAPQTAAVGTPAASGTAGTPMAAPTPQSQQQSADAEQKMDTSEPPAAAATPTQPPATTASAPTPPVSVPSAPPQSVVAASPVQQQLPPANVQQPPPPQIVPPVAVPPSQQPQYPPAAPPQAQPPPQQQQPYPPQSVYAQQQYAQYAQNAAPQQYPQSYQGGPAQAYYGQPGARPPYPQQYAQRPPYQQPMQLQAYGQPVRGGGFPPGAAGAAPAQSYGYPQGYPPQGAQYGVPPAGYAHAQPPQQAPPTSIPQSMDSSDAATPPMHQGTPSAQQ
uniref:SWI/SNF complex subunit SMARCC2 n=1 Tax=Ascaris suum TaxID=6253 RepID=F1KT08_ASCSU